MPGSTQQQIHHWPVFVRQAIPVPTERRSGNGRSIEITEQVNNLQDISALSFWANLSQSLMEFPVLKIDFDQWHLESHRSKAQPQLEN